MALKLEAASKNDDAEYCTGQFPAFLEKLSTLQRQLSAVFPDEGGTLIKEKGDIENHRQSIEKAIAAVDSYDNDAGIEILTGLMTTLDFGVEANTLLENSLMLLKQYNYDEAKTALNQIVT